MATQKTNWISEESDGIKYMYAIEKKNKSYRLKILTNIPRRFYYSILNEIGLMIEQKHQKELR